MSEKRRVYGRIELDSSGNSKNNSKAARSSPSTTTSSGARTTRVINNLEQHHHGNGISSTPGAGAKGAITARASPSHSAVSLTPVSAAGLSHGIKARVLGYSNNNQVGDSSSSSPSFPVSTPPPSSTSYRTPPASLASTSNLTPASVLNRAISPLGNNAQLPNSVSTKAFDRRVRAASTEPHGFNDSPTASLPASGNASRYGAGAARTAPVPTSPKRRAFPSSSSASTSSSSEGSAKSSMAVNGDLRARTKSRVEVVAGIAADPAKPSTVVSRPSPPIHTLSSPSLLPSANIGPGGAAARARLKSSNSSVSVFTRSTTSAGSSSLTSSISSASPTQSMFSASTSAVPSGSLSGSGGFRPPSPVRQRPPSPTRRPASPIRTTRSYSSTPSSSSLNGTIAGSPSRRTFGTSSTSNTPTPSTSPIRRTTTLASSMISHSPPAPAPPPSTIAAATVAVAKRQSTSPTTSSSSASNTSSTSTSSTSTYSTLSPEIFSPTDSAKTVTRFSSTLGSSVGDSSDATTLSNGSNAEGDKRAFRRGRRGSGSSGSSVSSVSGVESGKGKERATVEDEVSGGDSGTVNPGIGIRLSTGETGSQSNAFFAEAAGISAAPRLQNTTTISSNEIMSEREVRRSPKRLSEEEQRTVEEKTAHRDAKVNRKILDLEITNTSLLAINASLERTKLSQSLELRDLRRKIRDNSSLLLPPLHSAPLPHSSSVLLSPSGTDEYSWNPLSPTGYEEEDEELDWEETLARDPGFADVVRALEGLQRSAKEALERSTKSDGPNIGGKVLSQFMLNSSLETPGKKHVLERERQDSVTGTADTTVNTEYEESSEVSMTGEEEEQEGNESSRDMGGDSTEESGSFSHTPEMSLGVD